MKKTLIALAAVAVSSAAMAQVTISGSLAAGYGSDQTTAGVKSSGYGVDTAALNFSASEDLGGGLKAFGNLSIEKMWEDQVVNGNGASLGLSGGFGSLVFSASEAGDFLPIDSFTTIAAGTDADRITYTSPAISGFTAQVIHQDSLAGSTGFDADARGTSSALTVGVNYTNGPISADIVSADFNGATNGKSRLGVRASYNFGVAKVTYGQMKETNTDTSTNVTQTGLTIEAPVGPVSVAYAMATSKTGTAAKKDGYSLGVTYPLSKRTSIAYATKSHESTGTFDVKESSLLVKHSF